MVAVTNTSGGGTLGSSSSGGAVYDTDDIMDMAGGTY